MLRVAKENEEEEEEGHFGGGSGQTLALRACVRKEGEGGHLGDINLRGLPFWKIMDTVSEGIPAIILEQTHNSSTYVRP